MRAPTTAFLAALCALAAGCVGAPEAADWLAVGFQTPEQTFRTFQTGLRADLPDLEYRCLGGGFKRRAREEFGVFSQQAYIEARKQIFDQRPWLKLAAWAEVEEVRELGPGRVRLVCEVDTWFRDETFSIDLVREDYWEVCVGDERRDDDYARWREIAREEDGEIVLRVPLPEGLDLEDVGTVRAGREWKIDGFPLQAEPEESGDEAARPRVEP